MATYSSLCDLIMQSSTSNYTAQRTGAINKFTPHHTAGILNARQIGAIFQDPKRGASANYGIGVDGLIVGMVPEEARAWTSSSPANDHQAITVEVSNDQVGGDWHVSDLCINRLIDLGVEIRNRTGKAPHIYDGTPNGTITRHNMFAATVCPGPYLQSKLPYIADEINKRISGSISNVSPIPTPNPVSSGDNYVVQPKDCLSVIGQKLGVNWREIAQVNNIPPPYIIYIGQNLYIPNKTAVTSGLKTVDEIANEIIVKPNYGGWGTGAERVSRLTEAGYDAKAVQNRINEILL